MKKLQIFFPQRDHRLANKGIQKISQEKFFHVQLQTAAITRMTEVHKCTKRLMSYVLVILFLGVLEKMN